MGILLNKDLRRKALDLRNKGYSYTFISIKLRLPKSTLSDWLKNVAFVPNEYTINSIKNGTDKSAMVRHHKMLNSKIDIKRRAILEIGKMTKRDLLMFGVGLYLGEGAKTIESVRVINSDPRVIKIAIIWLTEIVGLQMNNLSLALHSYPDNNIDIDIDYWSKVTGIPKFQFGKTQIDVRIGKHTKHKLPHGTVQLRVVADGKSKFGVSLHRRIMSWIEAVYEQVKMFDKI